MDHPVWTKNSNEKAMDLLLGALCLILCKKVPTEIGVPKIDQLHTRVKLLVPIAPSTKPQGAVVRLAPATRVLTTAEIEEQAQENDSLYNHFDEVEQDNKAVALNGRIAAIPYTVTVINSYAARVVREELVSVMTVRMPEFFKEENKQGKRILDRAEKNAKLREDQYIKSVCNEYELPLFEVPSDVYTYE